LLTAAKKRLFIVQINGADSGVSGGGSGKRSFRRSIRARLTWELFCGKHEELGFDGPSVFKAMPSPAMARSILVPTM